MLGNARHSSGPPSPAPDFSHVELGSRGASVGLWRLNLHEPRRLLRSGRFIAQQHKMDT